MGHRGGKEIDLQSIVSLIGSDTFLSSQLCWSPWTALQPASWSGQAVASWSYWALCAMLTWALAPKSRDREVFYVYILPTHGSLPALLVTCTLVLITCYL